jgi:mercuric ion transport protein
VPSSAERIRQVLPSGITSLAGAACAACCILPLLIAAGIFTGGAWAAVSRWMPGIALALVATAVAAWWWTSRHQTHATGCGGDANCSC